MSITTYSQFLTELGRLIMGDEAALSELPLATMQQIISLGERQIYRDVKSRHNERAFSAVTVTNNIAPFPSDFESPSLLHFGSRPLKPVPEEVAREMVLNGASGPALYFAEAGTGFYFAAAVTDGTTLQGRYFCRLPALDAATLPSNALFLAEDDLFLYGCLAKAAPFIGDDKRIPIWAGAYREIKDAINTAHERAAYSAGRAARRPSTAVLR